MAKEFTISLAAARVNAKKTQDEVANLLHIGKKTLISWEKGETEPKVSQAMALGALYNIPLDYIFLPQTLALSEDETLEENLMSESNFN